jgi:MSHA pilin protein MshA
MTNKKEVLGMTKSQKGFTLIELVIVIVILGLLAAFAISKYISIVRDARISAVNGLAGGARSAVALAMAKYMVVGTNTLATVDMYGTAVACSQGNVGPGPGGVPTAAGIVTALQDTSGFTVTTVGNVTTFQPTNGGSATCQAQYTYTPPAAPATSASGVVVVTTTGC